ncbi:MAG: hypothetical protein H8E21_07790 [Gammaproteobacteria bacterium]|nr:hypothetical protein [Gammaproteobacteria bacterium]MBL6999996.1 hypothetical protein [Gammaproteobacteria bacterium]
MKLIQSSFVKLFILLMAGFILSACGGSDNDDAPANTTATLSGTAAVGAALASRQVTIVDKSGASVTTTTDANGKYSVTVTVSAKPFMLKVETDGEPLYSFAAEAGISNITPLTNLALHEANRNGSTYTPLSSLFSSFKDSYAGITETRLNEAKAKVNANLASVYSSAGVANGFDFFKTAFNADGSGIDQVLDNAGISIDSSDPGIITINVTGASAFSFNPGIDFSQFVVGGGAGSGGDIGTLPSYVASQVVDMEFCCAAAGAPYSNGEVVKFTFSGSGMLFLTESFTVVAPTFTDNSSATPGPYIWDNGTYKYELSVLNNAIHEVNVFASTAGTFLGQFTPVTGNGGGSTTGAPEIPAGEFGLAFKLDGVVTQRTTATPTLPGIALAITGLGTERYLAFLGTGVTDQLRMIPINTTGTYTCGAGPNSFRLVEMWLSLPGSHKADASKGSCTISVTSVGSVYAGTFSGTVISDSDGVTAVSITEGVFRVDGSSL